MSAVGRSPLDPGGVWALSDHGSVVSIVKIQPGGNVATRYEGTLRPTPMPPSWLSFAAEWTHHVVDLDGLQFMPGDRLHEYFSNQHPFNVFAVFSPSGDLRGWYANVTYPSWLVTSDNTMELFWHDLVVDIIALPDGTVCTRDEDELTGEIDDPRLRESILSVRDEVVLLARNRQFPFFE